jgi:hypothetical protein
MIREPIRLERGYSPWRPSPGAELVKQYHYFEIPITGVVVQGGERYLFNCAAGADEPTSFWIYLPLDERLEQRLDEATPEEFGALLQIGAGAVLALALNGPIVAFTAIGSNADLAEAGIALIDEVRTGLAGSEALARALNAA